MSTEPSTPAPAPRRVDSSMDLLNQVLRNPIDPDYARAAAGERPPRQRWLLALATVALGGLFALSGVQTTKQAPAAARERESLIEQIHGAEARHDELRAQVDTERARGQELRQRVLGTEDDRRLSDQVETVGARVGALPVTGPGVVVVVDDAPGEDRANRVIDRDLQQLANALWESGAEAVAINGHRLSAVTAIRGAGDGITVDYRSLVRPYRVEAIGEPRTLAARLAASPGGRSWGALKNRYGMRYDVSETKDLRLSADPGIALRHARRMP
ncbi:DUF881 domain-containing protein [Mariniluteicoccus flavus]